MEKIKYIEGQWFAVPLHSGGWGVGRIARGNPKSKGGLGYFLGPRFLNLPVSNDIGEYNPADAIFICIFGDLGIITGNWPILPCKAELVRSEWPVPIFYRSHPMNSDLAYLVEYPQDSLYMLRPISVRKVPFSDTIASYPHDGLYGYVAVEKCLTKIIDEMEMSVQK